MIFNYRFAYTEEKQQQQQQDIIQAFKIPHVHSCQQKFRFEI